MYSISKSCYNNIIGKVVDVIEVINKISGASYILNILKWMMYLKFCNQKVK